MSASSDKPSCKCVCVPHLLDSYAALQGTFYRTGPGIFELNGHPLHVFDGASIKHAVSCQLHDAQLLQESSHVVVPALALTLPKLNAMLCRLYLELSLRRAAQSPPE
jgi:hypothetical protein